GVRNITTTANYNSPVWKFGNDLAFNLTDPTERYWFALSVNSGTGAYLGLPAMHFWQYGNVEMCDSRVNDLTKSYSCYAPWMMDYLIYGLGHAKDLGYPTDALLAWVAPSVVNQVTDPSFNPYIITAYRAPTTNNVSSIAPLTSWA